MLKILTFIYIVNSISKKKNVKNSNFVRVFCVVVQLGIAQPVT